MSCLTPIQVDLTGSTQGESYAYENYYIYLMVSNVLVVVRSPIKSFIYKVNSEEMIEFET